MFLLIDSSFIFKCSFVKG